MSGDAIITQRLRLEPMGEGHVSTDYVDWLNDPEVVRFSEQRHRTHTIEGCLDYVRGHESGPNRLWAILEREGGRHVGNISASVNPANSLADVGLLIGARDVWGRGYGSEAFKAVVEFLLSGLGLRKVTAGTLADNVGMLRVMERAGMVPDGRRVRHYLVNGREIDMVHMARFREGPHTGHQTSIHMER